MELCDSKPVIVLGVIGADCHAVGNKILMAVFTRMGFDVVNLGVMVSQNEFIAAAKESNADAILVSSIYGHGEIDCAGLRERCNDNGLTDTLLYVGGNLVIGKRPFAEIRTMFANMGYIRVFQPSDDLAEIGVLLKADIAVRRSVSNKSVEKSAQNPFRQVGSFVGLQLYLVPTSVELSA